MNINFIGHAAIVIEFKDSKILIDPVLNWIGSLLLVKSLSNSNSDTQKQAVDIDEIELGNMLKNLDVVLYTTPATDCVEPKSFNIFANNIPILCHPKNENSLNQLGFRYVQPVTDSCKVGSLTITKVSAHRSKLLSKIPTNSQGFLLESSDEPTVYITGISSMNKNIKKIIYEQNPDMIIFNSRYKKSKRSNFSEKFVSEIQKKLPDYMLLGLNMDSGNHYILSNESVHINSKNDICCIKRQ